MPIPYAPPPAVDTRFDTVSTLLWTPGNGAPELLLSGEDIVVMPGVTGLDAPPVQHYTDEAPLLPGSMWQGARTLPRPVTIPVAVYGESRADARARRRALVAALSPYDRNGDSVGGTLTVAEQDGTRRHLDCVYTDGLEGNESGEAAGIAWATYSIQLVAYENPYFYGDPVRPAQWTVGAPVSFFPLAAMPFRLSPSQVIGATSVDNIGDVPAYPVWTLTGPATSLTLALGDKALTVAHTLAAGETLTIDTHPRAQSITDGNGVNLWPAVSSPWSLWALPVGRSDIDITVAGSGNGTELVMSYQPLYLAA